MKICYLAAGTFGHIQAYLDYFKEQGHEVYFIALSPSPPRNVPIINAWKGDPRHYELASQKWKYLIAGLRSRRIIRRLNLDIVHAHYCTSAGYAAWISGHQNTIISAHGSDLNNNMKNVFWRFLLKVFLHRAKVVHTVSGGLKRHLVRLGIPENKIINFNIGIDYNKFYCNRNITDTLSKLSMICNRSFKPVYDHKTIVEALSILKRNGVHFTMDFIGDGILLEEIKMLTLEYNLNSDVKFWGAIPYSDQPKLFKEHNIYISASKSDGTSLSLLEAMASGLIPIVSNISANRALMTHNKTAWMFEAGDPVSLAASLTNLFSVDSAKLQNTIVYNQERVRNVGNRVTNMKKLEKVYLDICG